MSENNSVAQNLNTEIDFGEESNSESNIMTERVSTESTESTVTSLPIVDNSAIPQNLEKNDKASEGIALTPTFNGDLDISGSVVFEGPFIVNGDTTMSGSVVIRSVNTDTQIETGIDETQNSQFYEEYNNRLNHKESKPHSFSIRSGPASVLASGTVIAFDDNPVEIIFGSDSTRLVIMFSDEPNPQNVQAKLIGENIIEFTFFKSQDQFEYIGTLNPLPLGIWQNRQLYIHCRLREFLEGDIAIDFGIYLVERDS